MKPVTDFSPSPSEVVAKGYCSLLRLRGRVGEGGITPQKRIMTPVFKAGSPPPQPTPASQGGEQYPFAPAFSWERGARHD
jgi:hypothetical protein